MKKVEQPEEDKGRLWDEKFAWRFYTWSAVGSES